MPDPDLTPAERQVRRLLADARHDEPLPDDVAARLDGVLADLGGEARRTEPVVDLAARRRRRIARNILVAAAAVVVVGVGISRIDLDNVDGDASSSADSGSSAVAPETATGGGDAAGRAGRDFALKGRVVVLDSQHFVRQLHRLETLNGVAASATSGDATTDDALPQELSSASIPAPADQADGDVPTRWCNSPDWGRGSRVAVRYDGQRGVLVLRRPAGGSRHVDLYLCGQTTPTRSTTVPAG